MVTPSTTKVDASGEEQVKDISPNTLEVAKTLSRVASLKPKSIDKGRRYKRRKETKGKKVFSSLDFQEEVDNCEQVSYLAVLKCLFLLPHKAKEKEKHLRSVKKLLKVKGTNLQRKLALHAAIRLDSYKREEAKQIPLDSLLLKECRRRRMMEKI
ncbi:hypothetical protein Tco_0911612 [Tanacetum coccineum]|uniref:Uncharacterized protein n=1 Tax=Tanacetum coccineum TaxID=301880 RepID=A0ABQ5CYZ5_9ASTR